MDTVKELQARFERLPVWPFSYWLYPVIGSSFFFAFYDMVNIGFVLPDVIKQFHTTQAWADWSITSGLIGYIVGSFLDARISDRFGRRIGLLVSVIAFSIGSFLAASSTDIILLIIWRFVMGLGLGAEIACGVSYASEMAPSQLRGKSVAIAVAFGYLGFVVTPYIAMGILAIAPWAWRLMFVIGGIGGILFLLIRIGMPKSPHWLLFHGRLDEVKQLIQCLGISKISSL